MQLTRVRFAFRIAIFSFVIIGCNRPKAPNEVPTRIPEVPTRPPNVTQVSGKKYRDIDGDKIEFGLAGNATEINTNDKIYPGQTGRVGMVRMHNTTNIDLKTSVRGDGEATRSLCGYHQTGNQITLSCDGAQNVVFTINDDGSLSGPPAGIWAHKAFSHMITIQQP